MHDKHHYLHNYCSEENDTDGNAKRADLNLLQENFLQLLPVFVLIET